MRARRAACGFDYRPLAVSGIVALPDGGVASTFQTNDPANSMAAVAMGAIVNLRITKW